MAKTTSLGGSQYAVPPIDTTQQRLQEELDQQGLTVPPSAFAPISGEETNVPPINETQQANFAAARANAQAELPENMYQESSVGLQPEDPNMASNINNADESTWQDDRQPMDVGNPQIQMLNARGEDMTLDQSRKLYEAQKRIEKERATGLRDTWQNEEELAQQFPNSTSVTNRGTITSASRSMGDALSNTQIEISDNGTGAVAPTNTSAMNFLKSTLGVSTVKAANLATMSLSMVAPIISGAAEAVDGEIQNDEINSIHAWGSDMPGSEVAPAALIAKDGGIPAETLYGILGNTAMKLYQMGNVDERGNALPAKQTNMRTKDLGATVVQSAVDAGYLISDKTSGEEVFRLHPNKGVKFYLDSRQMSREIQDLTRGRSSLVPVTDTAKAIGGANTYRKGDKMNKVNASRPTEVVEALRIAGSVGLVTSPIKTYFEALFVNQAVSEMFPAAEAFKGNSLKATTSTHPRAKVGQPIQGLTSTKKLMGVTNADVDPVVLKTKGTILTKLVNYHGLNVSEGVPRYAVHWMDPSVFRSYNDTEDANMQRDLNSRAVYGSISTPMSVSGTTHHLIPVTRGRAQELHNTLFNKVKNNDFSLTPEQRELTWLATIGKVLDVGATVGRNTDSFLPADLIPLVTPEFLQKAAAIGKVLSTIVPPSKSMVVDVSTDMTKLDGVQLTPEQLGVLNNFISSSNKKNWGYKLQAYLDAYNYLQAKQSGTAFTPRAMAEIDMSSAGRTMLANDIGNEEVLKRVGILYGESRDDVLNTLPQGNPRLFFLEVAVDHGVSSAFSKDSADLAQVWKTLLEQNTSPLFADEFGKSVLLTVDYGTPKSYQFGNARKFLNKNPEFKQEIMKSYDSEKELITDLNKIFGKTLDVAVDIWQQRLPKDITAILGMIGEVPAPPGLFGDKFSIGSYMSKPDGSSMIIKSGGNERKILGTKRVFDPMAPAKSKMVEDAEGNLTLFQPLPGSAAMNAIGPILGQYRESALMIGTMNYINGGRAPNKMFFMQPVHDNIIVSSDSFLQTHLVANNIVLPEVLAWNIQTGFIKDFSAKMQKGLNEIVSLKEDVTLGEGSKYYGTLVALDREYLFTKNRLEKGLYVPESAKDFVKYLESPSSGYIVPSETRPDSFKVKPSQLKDLIRTVMNKTLYDKGTFLIDKWGDLSSKNYNMKEVNARAKKGVINFMI